MPAPRVLILGVGNILLSDEGLGVRAVDYLREHAALPAHIRLLDGGTLGIRLMPVLTDCDMLLILDAVLGGAEPGSLYRLEGEDLRRSLSFRDSMHQTDLADTLLMCELAGHRPETVVLGLEPADITTLNDALTPVIRERLPMLAEATLTELRQRNLV
ncbi:MAG: HyaD/HybD family hydrogenase maturation endopeptidase [Deltaproteobacteria bacterium]|jgi:hydrogenase maturation protease|nr:HyaD/HybD family hydrogenase maturation endopeptidase [Deltaproteobacteria bacterium]